MLPKYDDTLYVQKIDTVELSNGEFTKKYLCFRTNERFWRAATVYEKFGEYSFLFPVEENLPCGEDGNIRCYYEGERLIHTTKNFPCDSTWASITERFLSDYIKIQNPVNDIISISLNDAIVQESIKQIKIYDILGQEILTLQEITSSDIHIPFSNYPQGIYIINITMKDLSSGSYKIVKQ